MSGNPTYRDLGMFLLTTIGRIRTSLGKPTQTIWPSSSLRLPHLLLLFHRLIYRLLKLRHRRYLRRLQSVLPRVTPEGPPLQRLGPAELHRKQISPGPFSPPTPGVGESGPPFCAASGDRPCWPPRRIVLSVP